MNRPTGTAIATVLLAGGGAVAGSFLAAGSTTDFVVAVTGSVVTAVTPGVVMTVSITRLGDLASVLAFVVALAVAIVMYAALAFATIIAVAPSAHPYRTGFSAGVGAWFLTVALTLAPLSALGAAVPLGAVVWLATSRRQRGGDSFDPGRRRVGKVAALVAGLGATSYVVGGRGGSDGPAALDLPAEERDRIESKLDLARRRALDIDTPSGLVSEIDGFYEVDINAIDPSVGTGRWGLSVTGAVDDPSTLAFEELKNRDPVHRFHTLRCVGEYLNGHKMDTGLWTGIAMDDFVDAANPSSDCGCVVVHATDGYYEEFPIDALRRGMLVYGMNGKRLTDSHGAPVRVVVPGHWGEISVKWVTEIEFLEKPMAGYWEQRGWHGTGPVKTVAKLHAVEHRGGSTVKIGGHAYAGYRGISAVEVTTDGGSTWQEATLSKPLPDAATWRQWAHEIEVTEPTAVTVRAIEADGTIQPKRETGPFPNGPSGWVTRTIRPN